MSFAELVASNIDKPFTLTDPPKPKPRQISNKPATTSNPAFGLARRCLGFQPISSKDLKTYEDKYAEVVCDEERFQRAGKDCIIDFLIMEMDISKRVAAAGQASALLYAEFHSEEEASIVKRNAKNLKTVNGHRARIIPYIPRSLFNRYRAVEEAAFIIRDNNRENATRIWVADDFQLRVRKKGDLTPWSLITPEVLINLPEQDPKVVKLITDIKDKRRPITPKICNNPQIVHSSFESENIYNLLGEENDN